jgi:hypothetical protein
MALNHGRDIDSGRRDIEREKVLGDAPGLVRFDAVVGVNPL